MNIKRINGISNSVKQTGCYTPLCIKKQYTGKIKICIWNFFLVGLDTPYETSQFPNSLKKRKRIKSAVKISALDILCPLRSSHAAM